MSYLIHFADDTEITINRKTPFVVYKSFYDNDDKGKCYNLSTIFYGTIEQDGDEFVSDTERSLLSILHLGDWISFLSDNEKIFYSTKTIKFVKII